ncbi:hypothetical protein GCM10009609_48110 [Pseudonocardia aurantiaca]|uniref:CBS domain-containing protein n=1 Tax=Pseudonocardia aurantiaca TaxID=75290 RepID=A0ABW4FWG0_9PSEU
MVAILPDSGRSYLSKFHSPSWLRRFGFLDDDRPGLLAGAGVVGAVRTVTARSTLGEAVSVLRDGRDQSALPVVLPGRDPRLPTALAELSALLEPVEVVAAWERHGSEAPLPAGAPPVTIGTGETAAEALAPLDDVGARHAVVVRDGRLAGLVTRAELARLRDASAQQPASTP